MPTKKASSTISSTPPSTPGIGKAWSPSPSPPPRPPFRYNPLHDLESIWWIAAYFVLGHEVDIGDPGDELDYEEYLRAAEQQRAAYSLFSTGENRYPELLAGFLSSRLIPQLHPHIRPAGTALEWCRDHLIRAYYKVEADPEHFDLALMGNIRVRMVQALSYGVAALEAQDVIIRPFSQLKRKRSAQKSEAEAEFEYSSSTSSSKRLLEDDSTSSGSASDSPGSSTPRKKARIYAAHMEGGPSTRTRSKFKLAKSR